MPLDATKVQDIILAHATAHSKDDCEFCKLCSSLGADLEFMSYFTKCTTIMGLQMGDPLVLFWQLFTSGLIVGVKLERTRVMEEEFKL